MKVTIYADGGSRGNPGDAAYAVIILSEEGKVLKEETAYIGRTTNNEAEYRALIAGLREALALGAREAEVVMDSELVIRQMRGEYRIKSGNLRPLAAKVHELQKSFDRLSFRHVRRDDPMITRADSLLNQELDDQELLRKIR